MDSVRFLELLVSRLLRTGVLVSPRDAEGLAEAMVELLGDRERARAMGLEGRRKVEAEFSLEACAAAVFDVYEELLSQKGRTRRWSAA